MSSEKGGVLIILLIIGVIVAATLYVVSLGGVDEANQQINDQTGASSTPAEKAQDAVDATQQAQDKAGDAADQLYDY